MARRTQETRKAIIAVARGIFARFGLSHTTIDDIARAAHMGKSSLYYHFKSKEEIFRAVLDQEILLLKETIAGAVREASTPQARLTAYFLTRMRAVREMVNVFSTFKDEYLRNYAFIQRIREGYDRYELDLIEEILRQGAANGDFAIRDITLTASVILTAMKGLEYEWATGMSADDVVRNITSLADVLFLGLVRRHGPAGSAPRKDGRP